MIGRRPIKEILVSSSCIGILILFLLWERLVLEHRVRKVRLRICVTGTRGKSTVTRLIASALKEAGYSVLAKTSGSKAAVVFPDGREEDVKRRGRVTILEGKRILKTAAELGVDVLVSELMSIGPECLSTESARIFHPHFLVVTNVRLDHREEVGRTKQEIARSLAAAIPSRCTVFIPDEEFYPVFQEAAGRKSSDIVRVPMQSATSGGALKSPKKAGEFTENICLALALTSYLGIQEEVALQGMAKAPSDFGSLRIWTMETGLPSLILYVASAFAANDPESARKAVDKLKEIVPFEGKRVTGLLNLRGDRGDRTLQWLNAFQNGYFPEIQKIVFLGDHVHAVNRRWRRTGVSPLEVSALSERTPRKIMERVSVPDGKEAIFIGMGNMGGVGKDLVAFWERVGDAYGA
ncbi:MAG: poly-gamma-glutamate synthase PgsB [Candidatus Aminicenantales bacterium]